MTATDQEEAARQLNAILSCHPPRLWVPRSEPPEILAYPSRSWYDLHLDANLALRRLTSTPVVLDDIDELAVRYLDDLRNNGLHSGLPEVHLPEVPSGEYRAAKPGILGAVEYFQESFLRLCLRIGTRLLLCPDAPTWPFFLVWRRVLNDDLDDGLAVDEKYGLYLPSTESHHPNLREAARAYTSKQVMHDLQALIDRSPNIGTWVMLAPSKESEHLISSLHELQAVTPKACRTTGFPRLPVSFERQRPRDASEPMWSLTDSEGPPEPLKRSLRSVDMLKPSVGSKSRIVPAAFRRRRSTAFEYENLTPESLLRLGWARAVETDSTIIVFSCGTLERIAIRRRDTQTLHISELIKVSDSDSPPYLRLQVGLYIAVVKDTIARLREEGSAGLRRSSRKRKAPEAVSALAFKRQKVDNKKPTKPESAITIAGRKDFMLLYLRYGMYDSPAPASFVRIGPCLKTSDPAKSERPSVKRRYSEDQCIRMILTSQLGLGATGVAHTASLQVVDNDGAEQTQEVVVKIALLPEPQAQLRHEFEIYRRLATHAVQGVPEVYGLFEDLEGGAIALVMSHCGECLWLLRRTHPSFALNLNVSERQRFYAVLDDIHAAGVRHHDVRPENLMLDPAGRAYFIDFDRANLDPTDGAKRREKRILVGLLERAHYPDYGMRSPQTPPST
ncbi:Protein kinase domain-containing protein [Mycena chlorophos]|uniref:Protein kinase domain-containing protein n=1 Tax=Mycena chlorophos TaxID=658473 RepID=A0A8H6W200_MYCCL|nr:Protein kinase domain-containing protein [Mycena chlorophos]